MELSVNGKGKIMKEYTVAYIKNGQEYAYDTYKPGTTIEEIVKELTYYMNRYGKDCDAIAIFEMDSDEPTVYYDIVNIHGHYVMVELF